MGTTSEADDKFASFEDAVADAVFINSSYSSDAAVKPSETSLLLLLLLAAAAATAMETTVINADRNDKY